MPPAFAFINHRWSEIAIPITESFGIRYYGLAYLLGFVVAAVLLRLYWKFGRSPMNPDVQADLLFWIIIGTIVGGRLGYFIFYSPATFLEAPLELLKVWEGGMASHGGFIGILLGLWWVARKHKLPWLTVGDIVCTIGPPGVLFGRIANFINQELWGHITTVSWGVRFPKSAPPGTPWEYIPPRHPSQLYEAALEGLLMLIYAQVRIWLTPKVLQTPGRLAGEFLLGYAVVRVIGEQFRENDPGIEPFLGLNRGAWLSFALAAAGIALVIHSRRAQKNTP